MPDVRGAAGGRGGGGLMAKATWAQAAATRAGRTVAMAEKIAAVSLLPFPNPAKRRRLPPRTPSLAGQWARKRATPLPSQPGFQDEVMKKYRALRGKKFGNWTVCGHARFVVCRCACGALDAVRITKLKRSPPPCLRCGCRDTGMIEYKGRKFHLTTLAAFHGIPYDTAYSRLFLAGWSIEKTLTTQVAARKAAR